MYIRRIIQIIIVILIILFILALALDISSLSDFKSILKSLRQDFIFNNSLYHKKHISEYNLKSNEKYTTQYSIIHYCEDKITDEDCFLIFIKGIKEPFLVYEKERFCWNDIYENINKKYNIRDIQTHLDAEVYFYVKNNNSYDRSKIVDYIRWLAYIDNKNEVQLIIEFKSGKVYYWDSYKKTYLSTIPKK